MKRKYLVVVLVALLLQQLVALPTAVAAAAQKTPSETDAQLLEQVKIKVARLGVGDKARVTVKYKNGTKLKGYISQAKDAEFVVRDRKTDAESVVPYSEVARVDSNRGHSTARNIAIGTAIGVGSVVLVLGILVARAFD